MHKLWLLLPSPKGFKNDENPWDSWYDTSMGFVVRAGSEEEARKLASVRSGDEGSEAWLNPAYSSCQELSQEGPAGVIMRDFLPA